LNRSSVALAVAVLFAAGIAVADKTVTYLSTGAKWDSMTFSPAPGGGVTAEVCGHTTIQGGGNGPATCHRIVLPAAHAISVDVNALATNRGLPFWKTQEGL
jgi:hypothetical protein